MGKNNKNTRKIFFIVGLIGIILGISSLENNNSKSDRNMKEKILSNNNNNFDESSTDINKREKHPKENHLIFKKLTTLKNRELFVIRYNEIALKGKNQIFFLNQLLKNIKQTLNINEIKDYNLIYIRGRILLIFDNIKLFENLEFKKKIEIILSKICGISSTSYSFFCEQDIQKINETVLKFIQENNLLYKKIRIKTNRSDKNFKLNSGEINKIVSTYLKENKIDCDYLNFDETINIDIQNPYVFIYFEKINSLIGGLPISLKENIVGLFSSGIDSSVAITLLFKRGINVFPLFLYKNTESNKIEKEKIKELFLEMKNFNPYLKLGIMNNFQEIQEYIFKKISQKELKYGCLICRESMFELAELYMQKNNATGIVTGENLGQVASQTLSNLNSLKKETLILRPLISFDKNEIIELSRKFGYYKIIENVKNTKCILLANNPSTRSKKEILNIIVERIELKNFLEQFFNKNLEIMD
jgi:thiamine biosynthesis protein ThiI